MQMCKSTRMASEILNKIVKQVRPESFHIKAFPNETLKTIYFLMTTFNTEK